MKIFLSIFSIAVVALLLAVPTVAQKPYNPPGYYVNWVITLHPANVAEPDGGSGIAQFYTAAPSLHHSILPASIDPSDGKVYAKLSVECEYTTDLKGPIPHSPLYVFVGPGRFPGEPFGKLVGQMQWSGGSATWSTLRPLAVKKGTTVTIVRNNIAIMQGRF